MLDSASHRRDCRDRGHLYRAVLAGARSDHTSVGRTKLDDMSCWLRHHACSLVALRTPLYSVLLDGERHSNQGKRSQKPFPGCTRLL